MLRPASDFKGLTIAAVDGDLGSVADLYFDDLRWTVRYLVVDTGTWLPGRRPARRWPSRRNGSRP
jgi:hypothetical protein